ncbi:MAG: cysteine ABC transporter substrate-binding protein [Treponema sp.]|jgi:polar amino acid transport system substrate-binding protein|nr:cysteine ABC transporter substrate-binding protein [Treponema sp.]
MKKLVLLLLAFGMTVSVFARGNNDNVSGIEKLKKAGIIRIGVFTDKAPFGYVDEQGVYQGYDVYFAHRIAKDLFGNEDAVEFVPVEAASRVEYLQANKVDIILANFTVTPERSQVVDFAKPYMKVALGIVSPDSAPITDISQLEGKTLIVDKGTTAELYFTKNHPNITLLAFDQNTEALNALKDGRGDALAHDNTFVFAWAIQNPGFSVGVDSIGSLDTIAPAVQKGNKALLDWLNNEITNVLEADFFHKAYKATLEPVYGDKVDPEAVVVENGIVK